MDIGEQRRVIIVEPEPIESPVPEHREETAPVEEPATIGEPVPAAP